jgi:pimeloyl-ACP methyl ester carboxylesterase
LKRPTGNRLLWLSLAGGAGAVTAGVALQRRFMQQISSDPEREVLGRPPEGRPLSVTSADGTALHAEVFGPDDGCTAVLAHGWTENLEYWTYQTRALCEQGIRVVAYDLRGHGDSQEAVDGDYSIERFGQDLEAVLSATLRDGARAVLAGHSLGAMAIAAWARDFEVERHAAGAVLINTGISELVAEQLLLPLPGVAQAVNRTLALHGFLGNRAPLPRFSTPLTAAAIRYIAFGPTATPAQVAFYERMLIACPPDVRASTGIAISDVELSDSLPRLTVPTTVIAGERDRMTPPSHARRIAEKLPQLERLVVLPETGHMAPLERHETVSDAIEELVAKVARDTSAAAARPSDDTVDHSEPHSLSRSHAGLPRPSGRPRARRGDPSPTPRSGGRRVRRAGSTAAAGPDTQARRHPPRRRAGDAGARRRAGATGRDRRTIRRGATRRG